jgi:arabinogalactan endo-1,4-beta-galactosidase
LTNQNDIALRYNKNIIIVETADSFTAGENDGLENSIRFQITRGHPATQKGQLKMMADIMGIVCAVPNRHYLTTRIAPCLP